MWCTGTIVGVLPTVLLCYCIHLVVNIYYIIIFKKPILPDSHFRFWQKIIAYKRAFCHKKNLKRAKEDE